MGKLVFWGSIVFMLVCLFIEHGPWYFVVVPALIIIAFILAGYMFVD